jgi:hypothetical protein
MPLPMVAGNLIVFLASLLACGFNFLLMTNGYTLMVVSAKTFFHKFVRDDKKYHEYEKTWYFVTAVVGSTVISALMFSLIFEDIYDATDVIDSSAVVLSLYPIYQLMMFLWLFNNYVKFGHHKLSLLFVGLAISAAVINTVLIFLFPFHDWTHYLNILLFVPPVFAIFATNSSRTFREEIVQSIVPIDPVKPRFARRYPRFPNEQHPAHVLSVPTDDFPYNARS